MFFLALFVYVLLKTAGWIAPIQCPFQKQQYDGDGENLDFAIAYLPCDISWQLVWNRKFLTLRLSAKWLFSKTTGVTVVMSC